MNYALGSALFLAGCLLCGQQSTSPEDLDSAHRAELSNDLPKAESIYRRILTTKASADTYQRLGLVQHLQNKFADASRAFENALRLDSKLWTSHLFLGIDYYRMNKFSDALIHLETARALRPDQNETRFWLGATHLALHHYTKGLEMLELLLETEPNNTEVLRLLAQSYADYGTRLLNEIGEKNPDSAAGLEVRGRAFEFEGSYNAALTVYRKAAVKDPQRPGIQEAIARVSNREH